MTRKRLSRWYSTAYIEMKETSTVDPHSKGAVIVKQRMLIWQFLLGIMLLIGSVSCGGPDGDEIAEPLGGSLAWLPTLAAGREIHEPQFLFVEDRGPGLVWRETSSGGSNLFVAFADDSGAPSITHINDEAATVGSYPLDELRASVATDASSAVAIGWTDSRDQIRVAISRNGARSFEPSIRVERVEAKAYRSFPVLDFDSTGGLHVVWIDSRFASGMQEEPADLYYAHIRDGDVSEVNLTALQTESVCGCCRPSLTIDSPEAVRITFRNTTLDGYRDIFTLSGSLTGGFSIPRRVSEPLWKLEGCPMAGPLEIGETVFWPDGSTGAKRLLQVASAGSSAAGTARMFSSVGADDWTPSSAPRTVIGPSPELRVLLLPGQPASQLAAIRDGEWAVVTNDLPAWATSALIEDGYLHVIGGVSGVLRFERHVYSPR